MATRKKVRKTQKAKTANRKKIKRRTKTVAAQEKKQIRRVNVKESYGNYPVPKSESITYEEAVIRNIVSSSKGRNVPDEAITAASMLSSLSGNLKELSYRHGMSVGKSLYKVKSAGKSYMFPYESVSDLVDFFQAAGDRHVTYTAFPDNITIKMHDRHGPEMGATLHSFEAGIISGFLSSAEQRYVNVTESACINDNGGYCKFSTSYEQSVPSYRGADTRSIERLAIHIAQSAKSSGRNGTSCMKDGYYLLESSLLFDKAYIESVKSIATYVGKSVGDKLPLDGRAKLSAMQKAIRLMNFGNPKILASKPLHMTLSFDGTSSRRGLVDISLAFINGLLSNNLHNDAVAVEHNTKGSYVIDIREKS